MYIFRQLLRLCHGLCPRRFSPHYPHRGPWSDRAYWVAFMHVIHGDLFGVAMIALENDMPL